jgi:hypothetical protein
MSVMLHPESDHFLLGLDPVRDAVFGNSSPEPLTELVIGPDLDLALQLLRFRNLVRELRGDRLVGPATFPARSMPLVKLR